MSWKLLDLFCGAGGASAGYVAAGFDVVGVDIYQQPRYPYSFIQGDSLIILKDDRFISQFDAIHASPPCQRYSVQTKVASKEHHPDLIPVVRRLLKDIDLPYVIENVPGSPLISPYRLCGSMFGLADDKYKLPRHRDFEATVSIPQYADNCRKDQLVSIGVYGGGTRSHGGSESHGIFIGKKIMGVPWMNADEACQAIPPAYAKHAGQSLINYLRGSNNYGNTKIC